MTMDYELTNCNYYEILIFSGGFMIDKMYVITILIDYVLVVVDDGVSCDGLWISLLFILHLQIP
jgi:hypothetical protein